MWSGAHVCDAIAASPQAGGRRVSSVDARRRSTSVDDPLDMLTTTRKRASGEYAPTIPSRDGSESHVPMEVA